MGMRTVMWPRQRVIAVAAAALVFATLSGCAPSPTPQHTASQSPHATPVFSSDKEALAAATKAYAAYLKVSDEILSDGGADPDRLRAVATGKALATDLAGFAMARDKGWHTTGNTTFDHVRLQSREMSGSETSGVVAIYLCLDVSTVDVLDSAGKSVMSSSRPARSQVEAVFDLLKPPEEKLILASNDPWNGGNTCSSG